MNSIRACALLLLAKKLYRPLFSDMLILITGEGAVIPSVEVFVAVSICCTIVVGGPPTTLGAALEKSLTKKYFQTYFFLTAIL